MKCLHTYEKWSKNGKNIQNREKKPEWKNVKNKK